MYRLSGARKRTIARCARRGCLSLASCVATPGKRSHRLDEQAAPLIVHRDVNPSNIYLSLDEHVNSRDFVSHGPTATSPGPLPSAESRENSGILRRTGGGEPFDHRADLFALSALLGES